MTKLERREYFRRWRAEKANHCACGEPKARMKWGEPVCKRCDDLEEQQDLHERAKAKQT
jgi:hypothetical protein